MPEAFGAFRSHGNMRRIGAGSGDGGNGGNLPGSRPSNDITQAGPTMPE